MTKRTSMNKIFEMVKLLKNEGHDIRIPFPKDRPLTILFYRAFENPNPRICSFKTLAAACELLENMWRESQG